MVVIGGVFTEDTVWISVLVGNTVDLKVSKQSFCSAARDRDAKARLPNASEGYYLEPQCDVPSTSPPV
jgi:hypothetical protein